MMMLIVHGSFFLFLVMLILFFIYLLFILFFYFIFYFIFLFYAVWYWMINTGSQQLVLTSDWVWLAQLVQHWTWLCPTEPWAVQVQAGPIGSENTSTINWKYHSYVGLNVPAHALYQRNKKWYWVGWWKPIVTGCDTLLKYLCILPMEKWVW